MHKRKPHRPDPFIQQTEAPFFKRNPKDGEAQTGGKELLLNHFGEPAFFQPQQPIQAKFKKDADNVESAGAHGGEGAQAHSGPFSRNTSGLPESLQAGLENLSGEDLSQVKVHRNSAKPEELGAHAYTEGQDIYLAPGQEKYLPHEGWHAVQQQQGRVQPTVQQKNALINDNSVLEQEADTMGARAMQTGNAQKSGGSGQENNIQKSARPQGASKNVIQRAMKLEYQLKRNKLYRDDGTKVTSLPRKFGPRDYLVHLPSGGTLETETHGQVEYETSWHKKWSKLEKQINEMQAASQKMHNAKKVTGSDGKTYKEFPFAGAMEHLKADKGFKMSGANWRKTQKEGDATVKSKSGDKENFRSTTSYAKPDNIIQTIDNGTEVFVHYFSSDGKWGRIEFNGKWGWMWASSLKMDSKAFESNEDGEGKYTDRPLKSTEKLLLDEKDTTWAPYVQISESFSMEQYATYLEDYDKTNVKQIKSEAKNLILDRNTEKAPLGEGVFQKMFREWKFVFTHYKLYNLLLMISQTVKSAQSRSTLHNVRQPDGSVKKVPGSAKYGLSLLSRTHFGSMFKSMSKEEQRMFKQMVKDKKKGILASLGLTTSSKLFVDGTATGYNPTVNAWLESIAVGSDILSVQSKKALPAAMGRYNVNEEKGKHEGLVRFEARNEPDNFPKLWKWDDHAKKHFANAMKKRERSTKNGGTGLEW
jgi:hypothetical protein